MVLGHFQTSLQHEMDTVPTRNCNKRPMQVMETDRTHVTIEMSFRNLNEAARQGHWEVVRWLHARITSTLEVKLRNTELVAAAVQQNNLTQMKWALAVGYGAGTINFADCSAASWQTRTEIIRYLVDSSCTNVGDVAGAAIIQAATMGDLAFVKWLILRPEAKMEGVHNIIGDAVTASCRGGHLAVLKWLSTYVDAFDLPYEPSTAMFEAAKHGKAALVEWLVVCHLRDPSVDLFCEQEQEMDSDGLCPRTAMDVAAQNGHMEVFQFLQAIDIASRKRRKTNENATSVNFQYQHVRCTTTAMDTAASNGHLSIVKYLHKHRSEGCTVAALDGAAANGYLTVVKWLHRRLHCSCQESRGKQRPLGSSCIFALESCRGLYKFSYGPRSYTPTPFVLSSLGASHDLRKATYNFAVVAFSYITRL